MSDPVNPFTQQAPDTEAPAASATPGAEIPEASKMLVGPSAPPMTPTLASSARPGGKSSSVSTVSRHTLSRCTP